MSEDDSGGVTWRESMNQCVDEKSERGRRRGVVFAKFVERRKVGGRRKAKTELRQVQARMYK